MSSFDTRNNSALMKRAEQLRRWEESDTNREPIIPKEKGRKIKFSSGCVFLAACLAGDKDEVVKLIESGADINTANVDGLTALHQACIDDNLEMVEFLLDQGADINRQDNEGWTPLHATASCGFVSIARHLVEHNADLTIVNSDGDLAVDIAPPKTTMLDYLQDLFEENGIDCEKYRQMEEQLMLSDAKKWLRSDASEADKPHPKTGATSLHVAAAKGYTKVLSLLLAGRANVDKQDNDGWTPLHAASHWGQREAAEMLVDAMADMDVRNYSGQTCTEVADERKMMKFMEELRANNKRIKRRPSSQIRISDTIENHIDTTPAKVIRVEVKSDTKESSNDEISKPPSEPIKTLPETPEEDAPWRRSSSVRTRIQPENPPKIQVPDKEIKPSDSDVILRRTQSFENDEKKPQSPPVSPNAPAAAPTTGVRSENHNHIDENNKIAEHNVVNRKIETKTTESGLFRSKISPGTIFKNFFKSFVPPVRDEESETQRKAHAKRVRETRRSTQGVTLDEIKSAEELVKKKNLNINNNNSTTESQNTPESSSSTTTTNTTSSSITANITNDRIPTTTPTTTTITSEPVLTNDTTKNENQDSDEIIASFTLSSPNKLKDRSPTTDINNVNDDDNDSLNSKTSATYTITPPRTIKHDIINTTNSSNKDDLIETISSSITVNVPIIINNKKTDDQQQQNKLLDEIVQNSDIELTDRQQQTSDNISSNLSETIKIREKRSLFDIDNANSLTLAEKLRNEANKYSEENQSNNDIISNLNKINDDTTTTTNNSNLNINNRKSDSNPSSPQHHQTSSNNSSSNNSAAAERRPSWRLKFDAGSKFKLEDASTGNTLPTTNNTILSAPAVIAAANSSSIIAQRRNNSANNTTNNQSTTIVHRPVPTSITSSDNSNDRIRSDSNNDVTITLRRNKNSEDKENDKENDSRSAQTTQAAIQRRRKPKRRSTGVVHVDIDDLDPDKQDSPGDNEEKESGNERSSRTRVGGSTSSLADTENNSDNKTTINKDTTENGEIIDYKALWEAVKLDNDKLKKQLKGKDEELSTAKSTIDRFTNATTKNSLSELEKRERRAMERKLSEMEEELKKLKTENERLRAENRALTRVVSKLTTSAQNQIHHKKQ